MRVLQQRETVRPSAAMRVQTLGVVASPQRCSQPTLHRRSVVAAPGVHSVPALPVTAAVPSRPTACLRHPQAPRGASMELGNASKPEARRPSRQIPLSPELTVPTAWAQAYDINQEDGIIGGGAFAKISKLVDKTTGKPYAMKVMNRPNFVLRGIEKQIESEVDAMRRAVKNSYNRHIVKMYDVTEDNDHVYIRLELCHCDLLRLANAQPGCRLKENDASTYTRQLLLGLRDLHCVGVLHRDIKPENLLVALDGSLKIADFGWCADLRDAPSTLAGTFQYMAPEILGSKGVQTEAVDVWSAGVTVLQLLTGKQLLSTYLGPGATGLSATDPHQATKVKTGSLVSEIYETCPPCDEARLAIGLSWRCWDLIRRMLMPEVPMRVSVAEGLGHPWMQEAPTQDLVFSAPSSAAAPSVKPTRLEKEVLAKAAQAAVPQGNRGAACYAHQTLLSASQGASSLSASQGAPEGSSSASTSIGGSSTQPTGPKGSPPITFKVIASDASPFTDKLSATISKLGSLSNSSSVPVLQVPTPARAQTPSKSCNAPPGSSVTVSAATAAAVAANVACAARTKGSSVSPRRSNLTGRSMPTPGSDRRCRSSALLQDATATPTQSARQTREESSSRVVVRCRSARICDTWTPKRPLDGGGCNVVATRAAVAAAQRAAVRPQSTNNETVGIAVETIDGINSRNGVLSECEKRVAAMLERMQPGTDGAPPRYNASMRRQSAPSRTSMEVRGDPALCRSVTVRPRRRDASPTSARNSVTAKSIAVPPGALAAALGKEIEKDALSRTLPASYLKAITVPPQQVTSKAVKGTVPVIGHSWQEADAASRLRVVDGNFGLQSCCTPGQRMPVAGQSVSGGPFEEVVSRVVSVALPCSTVDQRGRPLRSPRPLISPYTGGRHMVVTSASQPVTPYTGELPVFGFRDVTLLHRHVAMAGGR